MRRIDFVDRHRPIAEILPNLTAHPTAHGHAEQLTPTSWIWTAEIQP
jgi:hypothetical protein